MPDPTTLPRRAFLRLAVGTGLALAAGLAACDPAPVVPAATPISPSPPTPAPPSMAAASTVPGPLPTSRSPIADENLRPGTPGWDRRLVNDSVVRGYAAPTSVEPGGFISLHVTSTVPYRVTWLRMGWYGGAGARQLRVDAGLPATPDHHRSFDRTTGMVEAPWAAALEITVPDDWPTGMYVAILEPADGGASTGAPFVVRAPLGRVASTLFVSAQATWRAYDPWGGKSLYAFNSRGDITPTGTPAAAAVSFDRPLSIDAGLGFLRRWELPFIAWMEREGRDVDYAADADLEVSPEVVAGRRLVSLAGHPEYWSRPMRDTLVAAVDAGMDAAFFTANEMYWQVRLEDSPLGRGRRIVCYKSAARDPTSRVTPALTTTRWRAGPVLEPEARFLGVMYGHTMTEPADWVVARSSHWLYDGTDLRDGDSIAALVGPEHDTFYPEYAPSGTVVVARGPVRASQHDDDIEGTTWSSAFHAAAIRDATSVAGGVFAAGTCQWSWALDPAGSRAYAGIRTPFDPRVARMTANVFDRSGS